MLKHRPGPNLTIYWRDRMAADQHKPPTDPKRCGKCREPKPLSDFCVNRARPDGLSAECKQCRKAIYERWHAAHRKERRREAKPAAGLKRCCTCHGIKPVAEFYKCRSRPDGLADGCAQCYKARYEKWAAANPDRNKRPIKIEPVDAKRCCQCKQTKPAGDFYKSRHRRDGLADACKDCRGLAHRKWLEGHRDHNKKRCAEYLQEHRDEINDRKKRHHSANRDVISARRKAERDADPEHYRRQRIESKNRDVARWRAVHRALGKKWRAAHPDKVAALKRKYKARFRGAAGSHTLTEWLALVATYDGKCLACGTSENLTQDHIIPISRDGTHYIENIQPLCVRCNSSKGDRIIDYRQAAREAG